MNSNINSGWLKDFRSIILAYNEKRQRELSGTPKLALSIEPKS
jgi:hypothetical protein